MKPFPFAVWPNSVQKSISEDLRPLLETIGISAPKTDAVEEQRRLDAKRKEHYITPGSDRQVEPSAYPNPKDGNEWITNMEKKITKMADLGIIAPWTRDQTPQKTINTTDHPEFAKGAYDLSDFMRVDPWGRAFVFVNHVIPDGPRKGESVKIPYYHSSGNGGKTNPEIKGYVKPGSWAPYFGIDPRDGYILKTNNIDNDYSSAILRKYGQSLNAGLGQIYPVGKGKQSITDITGHLWNTKPEIADNIHNFYYWEFQEYPKTPEGHDPHEYWKTRIPSISAAAEHINSEIDRISPSNWSLNPSNLASGRHINPILRAIHGPGNFDDVDADKYTGTRREETQEDFEKTQQEKSVSLKSIRSKPFPFAIWPQTFQKGSLKTTNFLQEASRPLSGGRGILSDIFLKKDNKGNTVFPTVPSVDDRISTFKSAAIAPVIIPDSLRSFLRQKKYKEDAFDDIVSDNVTSHALDIQNHGEDKARRPVFFFEPDAHEQMIKHLEEGWDVFGARKKDVPGMLAQDGTKKPTLLEKGGFLIGSHHIDTETGTPYIVIKHYLPSTEESFTNSTSFFPMSKIQKTLKDLFTTDPTLFIVGSTHSHPGGLPVPSSADVNGLDIYQNPYNLSVIHAPRTVRDSSGAFIHGEDASNYLRNNASQTTRSAPVPAPYTRGPKGHYPYVGIGPQIYGEGDNTAFFSGFSYEPPTNFGVTRQTGSYSPVTHGFDDWRRISFPNNVQFISRSGGPSTRSLRSTENFPAKINHAPSLDPNDEESHTPEFWGLSAQPKSVFGDVTEVTPRSLSSVRTLKSQSLFPFAIWPQELRK